MNANELAALLERPRDFKANAHPKVSKRKKGAELSVHPTIAPKSISLRR